MALFYKPPMPLLWKRRGQCVSIWQYADIHLLKKSGLHHARTSLTVSASAFVVGSDLFGLRYVLVWNEAFCILANITSQGLILRLCFLAEVKNPCGNSVAAMRTSHCQNSCNYRNSDNRTIVCTPVFAF